jgi:hypothetical protein
MADNLSAGGSSEADTRSVAVPRFKFVPTMEKRTRFKFRVAVLMFENKDRNHKGRQGAYFADDAIPRVLAPDCRRPAPDRR